MGEEQYDIVYTYGTDGKIEAQVGNMVFVKDNGSVYLPKRKDEPEPVTYQYTQYTHGEEFPVEDVQVDEETAKRLADAIAKEIDKQILGDVLDTIQPPPPVAPGKKTFKRIRVRTR